VTALLGRREVGYSNIERLEVLRSARHIDHYRRLAAMFAALPKVALTEAALLRAAQVQEQLVQRGHHRGVKIPDLLIAAAAEVAGARVLHYGHDFDYDRISSITGQDVAWAGLRPDGRARPPEMIKLPMPLIVSKGRTRAAILPCPARCQPPVHRRELRRPVRRSRGVRNPL